MMEMKRYKLSEIGEVRMCKRILKEETNSVGGVPFFKIGTFGGQADVFITKEKFKEYKNAYSYPKKGDILISAAGTIGRTVVFDGKDAYFQDSNIVWIENDESKVLNEYLFYCYKNIRWTTSVGSTILRLYNDDIRNTDIIVPHLSEQKKISSVLSSLDDKIALNKKINAKLEAMAKRLYDYWFVQFDFPNEEGKPYKTSGGKMVWNELLKREIPEGWEVVQIKKIFENEIPGDWGEEQPKKNNTYQVSCIRGCDMVTMNDLPIRYILPSNATKLLKPNDFVIEISGGSPTQSTGRIVQITEEIINRFNGNVICSNFCHGVRILNKKYISYFLRMWNMFYDNKVFFNYEGKTSGLKNFQFDTFVENKWYMPPEDIVKKYDLTVNKIKAKIDKNESENLKLTAMRDRLLPLLMNGQVEVER